LARNAKAESENAAVIAGLESNRTKSQEINLKIREDLETLLNAGCQELVQSNKTIINKINQQIEAENAKSQQRIDDANAQIEILTEENLATLPNFDTEVQLFEESMAEEIASLTSLSQNELRDLEISLRSDLENYETECNSEIELRNELHSKGKAELSGDVNRNLQLLCSLLPKKEATLMNTASNYYLKTCKINYRKRMKNWKRLDKLPSKLAKCSWQRIKPMKNF
jgi:hypothetical protein